jgi:class 3 adenylate cyclase
VEPEVRYARNGDVSIAYYVLGDGPRDILLIPGFISHFELFMEEPTIARFIHRLASFSRLITYDKRNTGLSDRGFSSLTLDDYVGDAKAVLEAAGSKEVAVFGVSEGGPTALTFAASYPEHATSLILYGTWARVADDNDYPIGIDPDVMAQVIEHIVSRWGTGVWLRGWAPSLADDPQQREWWARLQRMAASPADVRALLNSYYLLDVRRILSTITAPTLVISTEGDRMVPVALGRYLADKISDAKYVELEGDDHFWWTENSDSILDEVEEFLTGDRHGPDPLRKLATILFTDIVGSTEHAAAMGDNSWTELLQLHRASVRGVLRRFNGREVQTVGDGFFAVFEGPTAAIRCADAIRAGAAVIGLQVRAGIHTGEVELMGEDIGGIAVHIAARVAAHANPDEIWVSGIVPGLVVGSGIGFNDRGRHRLKGVPEEWSLFSVLSEDRRAASRATV